MPSRAKQVLGFIARTFIQLFRKPIATLFHYIYYTTPGTWTNNKFLGYPILQNPMDLQLYQELVYNLKPRYIVQTGICDGGSIVYFSTLLDIVQAPASAVTVGIDISLSKIAATISHPRARLIIGDSAAAETVEKVKQLLPSTSDAPGPGMVVLDSDHSRDHVLKELRAYWELVSIGSYLVVEDTNVNGRPVNWSHGPGPHEAVEIFLRENSRFQRDDSMWERNLVSHHQRGWLKRLS